MYVCVCVYIYICMRLDEIKFWRFADRASQYIYLTI